MKRPAIFFDRDNTLIACDGYLGDPTKVMLVEGAAAAVARARQLGYATVVVSNQSGVARGMFTEDDVHAVNAALDGLLRTVHPGAVIDRHMFCPFHPEGTVEKYRHDSLLRKPKPGMILDAARTLALDLSRSWVIGDAPRDIEAGIAAGCRTILFHDPTLPESPATKQETTVQPEYTAGTLREAIEYIERHPNRPESEEATTDPEPLPPPARPVETPASNPIRMLAQPMVAGTGKNVIEPRIGPASSQSTSPPVSSSRLESLVEQLLHETRRQREQPEHDFSMPKLLAGLVQVLAIGALVYAYFDHNHVVEALLSAIVLQSLTTSLLLMGRR